MSEHGHDHTHDHSGHDHGGHDHHRSGNRRALLGAFALTSGFMLVEVVGGLITGSLALLADAAHMLSDSSSLALALFAIWLAARPATPQRSFGYKRAEILAALANGVTLVVVAIWILYEAFRRLEQPPEILGGGMLAVAIVGLLVNAGGVLILHRSPGDSLNVSAAMRHIIADLLGSVGVIVAAVVILLTGWEAMDAIVSMVIAILVAGSAWPILRDTLRILLEATPKGIDAQDVARAMGEVDGVREVHDLHIWTITSGFPALSAHVLVGPDDDCHRARQELEETLEARFKIEHTTLQVEHVVADAPVQLEVAPTLRDSERRSAGPEASSPPAGAR